MINFLKWKELYSTSSLKEQMEITHILTESKIPVKVKIIDSRNRITGNVILGANPMTANSAGVKPESGSYYKIYTEKDFYEKARKIIGK